MGRSDAIGSRRCCKASVSPRLRHRYRFNWERQRRRRFGSLALVCCSVSRLGDDRTGRYCPSIPRYISTDSGRAGICPNSPYSIFIFSNHSAIRSNPGTGGNRNIFGRSHNSSSRTETSIYSRLEKRLHNDAGQIPLSLRNVSSLASVQILLQESRSEAGQQLFFNEPSDSTGGESAEDEAT